MFRCLKILAIFMNNLLYIIDKIRERELDDYFSLYQTISRKQPFIVYNHQFNFLLLFFHIIFQPLLTLVSQLHINGAHPFVKLIIYIIIDYINNLVIIIILIQPKLEVGLLTLLLNYSC